MISRARGAADGFVALEAGTKTRSADTIGPEHEMSRDTLDPDTEG